MSSTQSSGTHGSSQTYFFAPNINATGPSGTGNWMVATVIDDNDLMFGGKSLSAWYEEDRCRQGASTKVDQERRGRSRERHNVGLHNHHHHLHHHQHGHGGKDGKP
jgi:hypothetical protein